MGGRLWLIYVTMVISYYGREIMAYLCDYGYILLWEIILFIMGDGFLFSWDVFGP